MKSPDPPEKQSSLVTNLTPSEILKDAIRAVPAVKWALGVAGIAAAVTIVAGFSIDYKVAVLGSIVMFGLMFGLVTFSWFVSNSPQSIKLLALTLAWTFVILICATSICIFTGFFIGKPRPLGFYVGSASPSPSPVQLAITRIPPYDPVGGPNSNARIAGSVSGVNPRDYRVVIYSFTGVWYVQPTTANPLTLINPDGTWQAEIQTGSKYTIILVPQGYNPLHKTSSSPSEMVGVIAATEIEGMKQANSF